MAVIKGAVFDLDGTLLDSMGVWEDVDRAFFRLHGLEMPDDYIARLNTMSFSECAAYTKRITGLPLSESEILEEWHQLSLKAYAEDVRLKPGAAELLEAFAQRDIPMAVATDLADELMFPALQNNGILSFFSTFSTTGNAGRDKRWPDVYMKAAEGIGKDVSSCIVFEDILQGIITAKNAGFITAAVADRSSESSWPEMRAAADIFLESLSSFPPSLLGGSDL